MLSTLIDHSTLSSVQRLIGDIGVALSFPIEGDVIAYDQYLQALLIYDEVSAVDDYKEEFRQSRTKRFDEIRFVDKEHIPYTTAHDYSLEATTKHSFRFENGEIAEGIFADLLRALDLNVAPAWYMASSEWYLHLRLLADQANVHLDKYGILVSAIKTQNFEQLASLQKREDSFSIETSDGGKLNLERSGPGSVEDDLRSFASGLGWIAQRSIFYASLAEQLKTAVTLHPIRHSYLINFALQENLITLNDDARAALLNPAASQLIDLKRESDGMLGHRSAPIRLPFFAALAVGHAGDPKRGRDHILQIRHGRAARALRSHLREIEELAQFSDPLAGRRQLALLHQAMNADISLLRQEFSRASDSKDLTVDMFSLSPSLSVKVRHVSKHLPTSTNKAVAIVRNLGRELMRVPTLGAISDRFKKNRTIKAGTPFKPERPRVEPVQFKYREVHFRKPL